jgi:hypothetical protein
MSRYPKIYALLKASGHTPLKAYSILLDATRGQQFAIDWIKMLFAQRASVQ